MKDETLIFRVCSIILHPSAFILVWVAFTVPPSPCPLPGAGWGWGRGRASGAQAAETAWPSGQTVGWRQNWMGYFPDSKAPLEWSRISKLLSGMRCQPNKPANDQAGGEAIPCGIVPQWLILGSFAPKGEGTPKQVLDQAFIAVSGHFKYSHPRPLSKTAA